ncbi:MAG: endolytic transglycosylase MltG, partial [Chitinophagaceae bacterium]
PVYLRQFGLDTDDVLCAVIPNTYLFFWNSSVETVFKKLKDDQNKFWNSKRKSEANSLGLTDNQAYILASIVEEETTKSKDKSLVASVYLNRLRSGMRLSADPTARFAAGDFNIQRITNKQTGFPSPYNTYLNKGLPPGPICTPSINTIDDVLHAPKTPYLFFCAQADLSGYNVYAVTYKEHLKNARAYQKALDSLNIH